LSAKEAINNKRWDHQLFLTMDNKGTATVHITKTEMGQHIGTALAQIVAEELEINWNDIRIDYPDSHKKWGLMITGSSWSINWTFDRNSRIGASARIALIEAGANFMSVNKDECYAKESKVIHKSTNKFVTYSEILTRKSINRIFSEEELKAIKLKKFGEYRIIGKSLPSLDIPEKINGTAKYGIDAFMPNMVYGKIIPWPTRYGSKPINVDDKEAKKNSWLCRNICQ
jgi:CO/xanthine dehydrogenase Mo-binding subunit